MIAVTGANGLLGNYIVKKFLEEGLPVTAVVRQGSNLRLLEPVRKKIILKEADIMDLPALMEALKEAKVVVHAAALVSFNPHFRKRIFRINVEGTRNVVNACLHVNIPALIHVSSVSALGRTKGIDRVNENSKWTNNALNTYYGESKYLAELEVYRGMEEGLCVSIVNPSVVLAPVHSGQSSAQLFSYVQKGRPFYGDGQINYVDVRDVTEMIFRLSQTAKNGERFIASAGYSSLENILREIAVRLSKKPPQIKIPLGLAHFASYFEEMRAGLLGQEPAISRQSVRLLREKFIFENTKAMDQLGIKFQPLNETLDWCCKELGV